ncbi:hypothetical protein ACN27J_18340 [Solwaraspora sp. WMMB762]|uniref:hypothetical protein n=1 Tax=Solwaraspora sp. WMMB762 TaxID=3404120 RepID=UPI003B92394D
MHNRIRAAGHAVATFATDYARNPRGPGLGLRANVPKVRVSLDTVQVAQIAVEICRMAG